MKRFIIRLFNKVYFFTKTQICKSKVISRIIEEDEEDDYEEIVLIIHPSREKYFDFVYEWMTFDNFNILNFDSDTILSSVDILNLLEMEDNLSVISGMIVKDFFSLSEIIQNYPFLYKSDIVKHSANLNIIKRYTKFTSINEMIDMLIPEYKNEIMSFFNEFYLKSIDDMYLRQDMIIDHNIPKFVLCGMDRKTSNLEFEDINFQNRYKAISDNNDMANTYGTFKRFRPILINSALESGSNMIFTHIPQSQQPLVIEHSGDINMKIFPFLNKDALVYRYICRYSKKHMILISFPLDFKLNSKIDTEYKYLKVLPDGMVVTSTEDINSSELEKICTVSEFVKMTFICIDESFYVSTCSQENDDYIYGFRIFDKYIKTNTKEIIETDEMNFNIISNEMDD